MTLNEMKNSSTSYKDIPNGEFAYRVWNAEKEDDSKESLPMGLWADEHGVSNKDFKAMIEFSNTSGYNPTDRTISNEHIPEGSEGRAIFQGQTFGFGDEIVGGLAAVTDMAMRNFESLEGYTYGEGEKTFDELYTHYRDQERQQMKEYRTNASGEALSYEIGGALISPAMLAKIPGAVKNMTAGKQAMTVSGAYGGLYGAGASEEESASGIAKDVAITAMTSSLFGLGVQRAIPFVGDIGKKLADVVKRNEKTPTMEGLRVIKNKAYELVNKSKARFGVEDLQWLQMESKKIASRNHHQEFKDASTQGALNMIDKLALKGDDLTLMQLDKIRQQLGVRFKSTNNTEIALKEMMDAVDTLILRKSGDFPEMAAARMANIKYKKAEKLEEVFHNAQIAVDNKGSIVKIYKTAVQSLLRNKKDIRWFSKEEVVIMEQFIKGTVSQRIIQRLGNYSPSVNNLMGVLGFTGWFVHKAFIIPALLGATSKLIADKSIKNRANKLIDEMGGIVKEPTKPIPGMQQIGGASGAYQQ